MNPPPITALRTPILAMAAVIVLSNVLVQHPINEWLTWGAFSYPLVFLVSDLTNRALGPTAARRVAWAGFAVAVLVSLWLAPWRIAVASGAAFILSQVMPPGSSPPPSSPASSARARPRCSSAC
jgi:uncharacterized PurR-regulated membrane protein YhhQ (DUF165 family)